MNVSLSLLLPLEAPCMNLLRVLCLGFPVAGLLLLPLFMFLLSASLILSATIRFYR